MNSDLASVPLERIEHEIGELAAHINAATCRWLLLVAEFDRREGHFEWGAKSCAEWLGWRCGVAIRAAREHVRVARRLAELPLVRERFERGELSYSKVRAISRVASPSTEADLVDLGLHATAAQLERLVRGYRGVVVSVLVDADRAHEQRYLDWSWEDDGSLSVRGRLAPEEGAAVVKALEAARDQLRGDARQEAATAEDGSAEPQAKTRPGQSNADALVAMADTLMAHGPSANPGGDRYQVVVHVDQPALSEDAPDGRCELEDGPSLSPETARRIACDASLVAITERDGRPLTVGRKTRAVPPPLRRALRSRDGGCCFPGCCERRFVDAHHIHHWARGGETKLSNLVLLCRHHHRLVHECGYRVERRGRSLTFRRPDGRGISAVPRNRRGSHGRLVEAHRQGGFKPSAETPAARSLGDRLDYGMAVDGLLAREGLLGTHELPMLDEPPWAGGSAEPPEADRVAIMSP